MPKNKTHSGASKRFRVTGTGKIRRQKAGLRHNLEKALPPGVRLAYAGRQSAAVPATGSYEVHAREEQQLVEAAFDASEVDVDGGSGSGFVHGIHYSWRTPGNQFELAHLGPVARHEWYDTRNVGTDCFR